MTYRRLCLLILVAGSSFIGSACSKTNLGIPPAPASALVEKQRDEARPLYFIDSVEVNDIKQVKIDPNDIKSINVFKAISDQRFDKHVRTKSQERCNIDYYDERQVRGICQQKTKPDAESGAGQTSSYETDLDILS